MNKKHPLLWLLAGAIVLGTLLYSGPSKKSPKPAPVPSKPAPKSPLPKPAPPCPH